LAPNRWVYALTGVPLSSYGCSSGACALLACVCGQGPCNCARYVGLTKCRGVNAAGGLSADWDLSSQAFCLHMVASLQGRIVCFIQYTWPLINLACRPCNHGTQAPVSTLTYTTGWAQFRDVIVRIFIEDSIPLLLPMAEPRLARLGGVTLMGPCICYVFVIWIPP
jgi:hypothetical protein